MMTINNRAERQKIIIKARQGNAMDKPEIIGARLKAPREALGHHKYASTFCRVVEISDQAWNHYEHGHRRIALDEAMKVVTKTGVSLDWIYRGLEYTLPLHIAEKLRQVDA